MSWDLATQKAKLLEALKNLGVSRVEVYYDGSGDSGQVESVEVYAKSSPSGKEVCVQAEQMSVEWYDRWAEQSGGRSNPQEGVRAVELKRALTEFGENVICDKIAGYENEDGGFGYVRIDVKKKKVTLEHNERYTETREENFTI